MTDELGRELTSAERIAIAEGKTTIMDILHGVALKIDAARDAEVHTIMPSGVVITRGELWREMHQTMHQSHVTQFTNSSTPWIVGVNASSNMFA